MSGLIGIFAFDENWTVSRFLYYGLMGLQHRGQESAGIATFQENKFYRKACKGLAEEAFKEEDLQELKGNIGCGSVSTNPDLLQPLLVKNNDRSMVLVFSGALVDGNPEDFGSALIRESLRSDLDQAALTVMEKFKGGYSFIALTDGGCMVSGRDPMGIRPLCVGGLGFDLAVFASESSALDVIGSDLSREVEPGEVITTELFSVKRTLLHSRSKTAYCSFEYVYYARPDSVVNGIPVYDVRRRIGLFLAKENPVEADVVIGVPETAVPFAMAYSQATGISVEMGFVRTGRSVRTAIKPTQFERLVGVQLKLNPIQTSVKGKRVILIDDSVVRGTTLRNTVYILRKKGAKEVHVKIGSPAIVARCPYGATVPPEDELIGRALTSDEIAQVVGADSFSYLSMSGLLEAIGLSRNRLCLGCFTGEYPV
ncbi:amidophosphoribosyltransferase [Candidatus Bathyarchaeota archaeon]|nr:amidophosphoribosyltransferase [Candidatus Bathyarchaeota archaeon]MBS7613382.1 amidophosphoribosyltransferase [Candidatus Bathyarchaeota archaeon]MBS7618569.1 amidophosphoribosyltransferase [Candidatus Bathyarchaeota archaeon]